MARLLRGDESGLAAHYRFAGVPGTTLVRDLSGRGLQGRLAGGAHVQTPRLALPPATIADIWAGWGRCAAMAQGRWRAIAPFSLTSSTG